MITKIIHLSFPTLNISIFLVTQQMKWRNQVHCLVTHGWYFEGFSFSFVLRLFCLLNVCLPYILLSFYLVCAFWIFGGNDVGNILPGVSKFAKLMILYSSWLLYIILLFPLFSVLLLPMFEFYLLFGWIVKAVFCFQRCKPAKKCLI